MHGPHKSRRLLVDGPDDATVRPFLVPLRCYYCAALIGRKSTLIRRDIYTPFHSGQSRMKQVGEDLRIATHKLCAFSCYISPRLPRGYTSPRKDLYSCRTFRFLSAGELCSTRARQDYIFRNFRFLRFDRIARARGTS